MSREDEFLEDHQHLFQQAQRLRNEGKEDLANLVYYLLHSNLDKCRLLDRQTKEIANLKKKDN